MKPLKRAVHEDDPIKRKRIIEETSKQLEVSQEEVAQTLDDIRANDEVWINGKYQVNVRRLESGLVWLSIKRRDKKWIHDWRDLQDIKNQLVGKECEGVELYPAESRLVDTANQYHIFVIPDPKYRFPFGFQERKVNYESTTDSKQRPQET